MMTRKDYVETAKILNQFADSEAKNCSSSFNYTLQVCDRYHWFVFPDKKNRTN